MFLYQNAFLDGRAGIDEMNKTLSIEEWHQMAEKGNAPPVRITLSGYSMNPLIRGYRDYVTVVQQEGPLGIGDIVLFCEPGTNRYVMHRVWTLKGDRVLTWGDNCRKPDGWMRQEDIWGKAVLIERGKRVIHLDPQKGVRWATIWHHLGRIYRFGRRIKQGVLCRIKKSCIENRKSI